MKRILALFLTAALLLALLGGCTAGGPENTVTSPDPSGAGTSAPPSDTTQEPSLALPSEGPSEAPPETPSDEPGQESSQPPATDPPVTAPPATDPPVTAPPATDPPVTAPPATDPPVTAPPATDPPVTAPPESAPPESDPPASAPPFPGFGGVIIPGFGGGGDTDPSPEPSRPAGGDILQPTGPSGSDIDLEKFLWEIAEKYDFPGIEFPPDEFLNMGFPGLGSIPVVQRVLGLKNTTPSTSEIDLIQVTNLSDLSKVEQALQDRVQYIKTTQSNYPDVVRLWSNNYQIVNRGNYIMLVVDENCDVIVADFYALF